MQPFAENTITTVFPFPAAPSRRTLGRIASLWSIVLAANVVGACVIAWFCAYAGAISPDILTATRDLSHHATGMTPTEGFARGIPAGLLVAAIVWMLPDAKPAALAVIVAFTCLIAAGDFTHIVAGSVGKDFLLIAGELGPGQAMFGFFLPVFAGNVASGTAILALLARGEVNADLAQ